MTDFIQDAKAVMEKCLRGNRHDADANQLHIECYATIGVLINEILSLKQLLETNLHQPHQ